MKKNEHSVPLLVKLYHFKNTGSITVIDKIIAGIKPSRKCEELPQKILFNRNDKIGDALVTVPVLRDLKLNHPPLAIDVLCSETNKFIFEGLKFINKIHLYNEKDPAQTEAELKAEKYDAIVDLVGVDKPLIRLLKRCSPFLAGSRLFAYSWVYDYYLKTNWVSEYDDEPMTRKIEFLLKDCFGFRFDIRNVSPLLKDYEIKNTGTQFDILFHLGTTKIRKLNKDIEQRLIESISKYKVLITDGGETERFNYYRSKYAENSNFTFRLYNLLEDMAGDAAASGVILCYDGGQAHFLGQFTRCIVLVGTLLLKQWAPYDFSDYQLQKKWNDGVEAYVSGGNKKHSAITFPVWCAPCFNVGCSERPCINNITPEQVMELLKSQLNG